MQFLHGLQDIRTETTQILTRLRGHRHHIDLNGSVLDHDNEVAVATKLGDLLDGLYAQVICEIYKVTGWLDTIRADSAMTIDTFDHLGNERKFIFLPFLAHLKRLASNDIAFRTAQSDNEFALTFCIDGAYIVLAINVQRTLENAGLGLTCRNLLRVAHIYGIVLDQSILAAIAESRPLLSDGRNLHIARRALEQCLSISSCELDIAIGSLSIVHPERHKIAIGTLQSIAGQHLLTIPIDGHLATTTLDAQFVPFLFLIHLLFCGRCRNQRRERTHPASRTSTKAVRLTHLHRADGEIGSRTLLLQGSTGCCFIGRINLRLSLSRSERTPLVIGVVYAYIIRRTVSLIAESKTDVHQTTTPCTPCQLVRTPVDIHREVEVTSRDAINLERLLVTGR